MRHFTFGKDKLSFAGPLEWRMTGRTGRAQRLLKLSQAKKSHLFMSLALMWSQTKVIDKSLPRGLFANCWQLSASPLSHIRFSSNSTKMSKQKTIWTCHLHIYQQRLSDPATPVSRSQSCRLISVVNTLLSNTDSCCTLLCANRYNVDSRSCNISKHVSYTCRQFNPLI